MEAGASFGFAFIFSLIAGSGGGELLNYIDTATYWQSQGVAEVSVESMTEQLVDKQVEPDKIDDRAVAVLIDQLGSADFEEREQASAKLIAMGKPILPHLEKATKSDDAEVALRAENIIKKIQGTSDEGDMQRVRRLVAIRTLGELKDKAAIPALEKLKKSDRPFESELARRAIDQINGKAYQPPKYEKQHREADLAMLPADVGVVGQMTGVSDQAPSLDEILNKATLPPGMDPKMVKAESTRVAAMAISRIGNVRVDAVTMAVSAPITNRQGFVVFVGRGSYDGPALEAAVKAESRKVHELSGQTVYEIGPDVGLILLDDHRIMGVIGENEQAMFEKMAKLIATGKETLADNKEMSKLVADVDKSGQLWAVSKLDPSYKTAPFMQAFDTATLVGKANDAGNTAMTLKAVGSDAEQVGAAVEMINALVEQGKAQLKQIADSPMGAMVKPYQETLETVKIAQDDTVMTITLESEGVGVRSIIAPIFVGMPMQRAMHAAPAQPQIQRRGAAPVQRVEVQQAQPAPNPAPAN